MFGGLAAIVIAIWFYRSAESRGLPGIQWAIAGAIAFYVPNVIWSLLIAKPNPALTGSLASSTATCSATVPFSISVAGLRATF